MLGVLLGERVGQIAVGAHDLLELLDRLDARLRVTSRLRAYSVALEDVVATAVVVVVVRHLRLLVVAGLLADLREEGDVVGGPVALRRRRSALLRRRTGTNSRPAPASHRESAPRSTAGSRACRSRSGPPPSTTSRLAASLTWLLYVPLLYFEKSSTHCFGSRASTLLTCERCVGEGRKDYDERRHRVGSAVLVQLLVEDGVRRLHRAQTVSVHVEIVLRVDEA